MKAAQAKRTTRQKSSARKRTMPVLKEANPDATKALESIKAAATRATPGMTVAPGSLEMPVIVPAAPGTFILQVVPRPDENRLEIFIHVCTHFERFITRLVPRGLIPMRQDAIEAAVLHPTGHVSSVQRVATYDSVDRYREAVIATHFKTPEKKPEPEVARETEEDLIG